MFYLYGIALCVPGVLLPEMVTSLVLLQIHAPTVLHTSNCVSMLQTLLDILDKFNGLAPGIHKEDTEDLAWPGIKGKLHTQRQF